MHTNWPQGLVSTSICSALFYKGGEELFLLLLSLERKKTFLMRAHPGHKDDGVQMTGGLPAIQTRKKMVKVICNQALDEMLVRRIC